MRRSRSQTHLVGAFSRRTERRMARWCANGDNVGLAAVVGSAGGFGA